MIKLPTQNSVTPAKEVQSMDMLFTKLQELARIDAPREAVMREAFDIAGKITDLHNEDSIGDNKQVVEAYEVLRQISCHYMLSGQ